MLLCEILEIRGPAGWFNPMQNKFVGLHNNLPHYEFLQVYSEKFGLPPDYFRLPPTQFWVAISKFFESGWVRITYPEYRKRGEEMWLGLEGTRSSLSHPSMNGYIKKEISQTHIEQVYVDILNTATDVVDSKSFSVDEGLSLLIRWLAKL